MTDTISYNAADFIAGQDIPHKKGHMLRWLREQPMTVRSEFILAVCDLDLLVGLELSKKVELRGTALRRVLARGLDLDVSSIRVWLHYCRTLLGTDGLLSFLEELVEIEPERVKRTGYWLRFSFRGGLDRYHQDSLDALYRRCAAVMAANTPVASAIESEAGARTFRLADAMNTYNSALVVLRRKGYQLYIYPDEREGYLGDYWAIKEKRDFIAKDPLRLLGLVSIWEHFGDQWEDTPEEQIDDAILTTACPEDDYDRLDDYYADLDDVTFAALVEYLRPFFEAIGQPLSDVITRPELGRIMTTYWLEDGEESRSMPNLSLSWTVGDTGEKQDNPSWKDVEQRLVQVQRSNGVVTLEIENSSALGPQNLQVFCDRSQFLMMLGEEDEEDWNVRSYTNTAATPEMVDILGNYWDARSICHDFSIVLAVFREFFKTGDVSREMLD
jgi:hypothetical protein